MEFLGYLLFAMVALYAISQMVQGARKQPGGDAGKPLSGQRPAIPRVDPLDGDTDEYEIVGESHYQRELAHLFGPKAPDGIAETCSAHLVPEPSNAHDKHAIRCQIAGLTVGYLRREDAKDFGKYIRKRKLSSMQVVATVRGGWKGPKDEGHYGVTIEVPAELVG